MPDGISASGEGGGPVLEAIAEFAGACDFYGKLGVAISGGSDSTGLLTALHEVLGPERLIALTVDHGLRDGSAGEARMVGELCDRLDIEHEILNWTGEKPQTGIQAAARAARQTLLREACLRRNAKMVAIAHTSDDQDETRAMRALRNRDELASGQAGIPPATLIGGDIWFVRPLLGVRRQAIRTYLSDRQTGWLDDPSNSDPRFERVRMRMGGASANICRADEALELRLVRAEDLARDLDERASMTGGDMFEFEMSGLVAARASAGVEALIGLAGGRARAMDRHGRARLKAFLAGETADRITLGRVRLVRRSTKIALCREKRNIEMVEIAPGKRILWDGRYMIENLSNGEALQVRGGGEAGISAQMARQRYGKVLFFNANEAGRGNFAITPVCGRASRILPVYELGVANALARLCNRGLFPSCPWRGWQKVVRA